MTTTEQKMLSGGQEGLVIVIPGREVAVMASDACARFRIEAEEQRKKEAKLAAAKKLLSESGDGDSDMDVSGLTQNLNRAVASAAHLDYMADRMALLAKYAANLEWYVLDDGDITNLGLAKRG